jgi:malonate decarboxylase gamma subunit
MTLDEILPSLFPNGHDIHVDGGVLTGAGTLQRGGQVAVIGIDGKLPVGVDEAIRLSRHVVDVMQRGGGEPILILLDSDSQRMSKRDELLGLNEFLAHLAKCLIHADMRGHRTVGLLYGHTAAGAFIATAMATRSLVALPGASPAVMDLPSMSRVTKLPIEVLEEKARSTPVFAPGLANMAQVGAVAAIWDDKASLAGQLQAVLDEPSNGRDARDRLGENRKGRLKAADIAERVHELAVASA